ncbi:response regulator [Roseateles sp.]|uniref:response regulator n=1 Tax=Roseateles sp. TaxID=1971397 RepID=UPI002E0B7C40|nr:response regulator [Roseateles sp.]HEV6963935.1 response regulator [Roseateles sp.]
MPKPARQTVLYVEDHPVNVLLMAAILERRPDLDLVVANTGAEALRLAEGLGPVLLLLDLGLPDCHGSELLPRLRALPGCASAPAVAVTADADFEIEGTSFCELWPKPLVIDQVLQRIDTLTGSTAAAPPSQRSFAPPPARLALASFEPAWP